MYLLVAPYLEDFFAFFDARRLPEDVFALRVFFERSFDNRFFVALDWTHPGLHLKETVFFAGDRRRVLRRSTNACDAIVFVF